MSETLTTKEVKNSQVEAIERIKHIHGLSVGEFVVKALRSYLKQQNTDPQYTKFLAEIPSNLYDALSFYSQFTIGCTGHEKEE